MFREEAVIQYGLTQTPSEEKADEAGEVSGTGT